MPIYKRGNQKIHFVHVPKTGGMSIREMLTQSGWIDLYENQMLKFEVAKGKPYHRHMPYSFWKDWPEVEQCSFEFMFVRNPVTRLNSLMQMWLRDTWLRRHSFAFEDGGLTGKAMRSLFEEVGVISPDTPDSIFRIVHASLVMPESRKDAEQIAQANGLTFDQYAAAIDQNTHKIMKRCADLHVLNKTGMHLSDLTWLDLMELYSHDEPFLDEDRFGVRTCPAHRYVSPNTHVYRQENFGGAVQDLISRGILRPDVANLTRNIWKPLNVYKTCTREENPENYSKFLSFYRQDFEIFGYDPNTPFPGLEEGLRN